jgi:pimeloyl-ACP methyl ester carboxylesterase
MEMLRHHRVASRLAMAAVAFVLASLSAQTLAAAEGPPRRLPPAGVPATELASKLAPEKRAAWDDRAGRIADVRRRLAAGRFSEADQLDVEVLLKAVEFAVDGEEWWQPADLDHALWAVAEARARVDALDRGEHPWRATSGLSVHGFRSAIDGSVQPYGLWIPEGLDRSRPVPLWIWLHGRGERETDLHFLYQRAHKPPEFQPADAVLLLPFGRYCNGWKGPGMVDVFEARDAAGRLQPIDPDRVVLAGFSMGGAGAWQIGARRAGEFCAVHGGAGFVDTRRYTGVDVATLPWYEVRLWATTDVPPVARNLLNLPAIAYSGELDKQRAASEIMVETMAAEGRDLPHVIGAGMPHKYDDASKTTITGFLRQAVIEGRRRRPDEVHLATTSLADARIAWVELLGLGEHFTPARVDAARGGADQAATITATTTNVTAVAFHDARGVGSVRIDGHDLAVPAGAATDEFVLARTGLHRAGEWCVTPRTDLPSLRKRPGLTGPIDDAFTKPFVVVPPAGPGLDPAIDEWVGREFDHFRRRWRDLFRGELPVVAAADVTEELVRDKNLILFGDPVSNPWIARVLADLPLQWTSDTLTVAGKPYAAARHVPVMIHPNPLAPPTSDFAGRAIVLNSGFTFREAADTSNAWQNPKLPDWAVVDISVPPDGRSPGRVVDAGFCDEFWRIVSP